ncbi:hypothetical protein [Dyadobacter sp. CY312]|uniref:hypothetical protein n=1 Tax=Dyadobacter sp. CY312 TaxID=2907303 RepID=UPI001F208458|nr:hypothetical protein [Dyadobacter sp. CY312]MCE7040401.1 hypothetical protein [Dyadobacter sp. CY312]
MKNRTAFIFAISFRLFTFFSLEASAQSKNASEVFPKGEAAPAKISPEKYGSILWPPMTKRLIW